MSKRRLIINKDQLPDFEGGGENFFRTAWVFNSNGNSSFAQERIRSVTKGSTLLYDFTTDTPREYPSPDFSIGGVYPLENGVYRGKILFNLNKGTIGNIVTNNDSFLRLKLGRYFSTNSFFQTQLTVDLYPKFNEYLQNNPTHKNFTLYIDFILNGFYLTSESAVGVWSFNSTLFGTESGIFSSIKNSIYNFLADVRIPSANISGSEVFFDGFIETNITDLICLISGSYCEATDY